MLAVSRVILCDTGYVDIVTITYFKICQTVLGSHVCGCRGQCHLNLASDWCLVFASLIDLYASPAAITGITCSSYCSAPYVPRRPDLLGVGSMQ